MKIGDAATLVSGGTVATDAGGAANPPQKAAGPAAPNLRHDSFERVGAPALGNLLAASPGPSAVGLQASEAEAFAKFQRYSQELQSDLAQLQIFMAEKEINEAGVAASDSKDGVESARDRKKAAMDNIQKLLDILRSMNPQI